MAVGVRLIPSDAELSAVREIYKSSTTAISLGGKTYPINFWMVVYKESFLPFRYCYLQRRCYSIDRR